MKTQFIHINKTWNAEPNVPELQISVSGSSLILLFYVNPWAYEGFFEGEMIKIIFSGCGRYRIGSTNDEGWYRGQ
jgi:hypothetical protein